MNKRFLYITFITIMIALIAIVYFDTNVFKINNVEMRTDKLPEGTEIRVLQISDVHNKVFGENNERLIDTVKELNADIIVITGDLIDRRTVDFQAMFTLIENLITINDGIYFVTGNHEWDNSYRVDFLNGLIERNVTILDNRNTEVTVGNVTLNVIGVDDVSREREDIDQAFAGINEDSYTILLSHTPDIVKKYKALNTDLILSGHTHGGQIRLPFIGAVVAPDQGFFPEYDKGIYEINKGQYLYIDSGLGTSVAPIRFLNKSQISLITINAN